MKTVDRNIVDAIRAEFGNLQGKKRHIAQFIVNNPEAVAFTSLRKIASSARVSTSLVMSLLKHFGYNSYEDFKADVQDSIVATDAYFSQSAQGVTRRKLNKDTIIEKIVKNDCENIEKLLTADVGSKIDKACEKIYSARAIFVVGMRASACIAAYMAYQLQFIKPNVALVDGPSQTFLDQIADITASDLVIAVSYFPYTLSTIRIVEHAKKSGAMIVSLTDNDASPIALMSDVSLMFAAGSPLLFNSITSGMTLSQIITAHAMSKGGQEALKRIGEREKMLEQFKIFKD